MSSGIQRKIRMPAAPIARRLRDAARAPVRVPFDRLDACRGLTPGQLASLAELLEPRSFRSGECILRQGDAADAIYFLVAGSVSVRIGLGEGRHRVLSCLEAGSTFGETAAATRGPRSADVIAESDVTCYALPLASFDGLDADEPVLKVALLRNLLGHVSELLRRLTGELGALVA